MLVGVGFDNTLVCYDGIFHKIALEEQLIPEALPKNKNAVRDYLRAAGLEPRWTEMQGLVYGSRLVEAEPYPGALEFFKTCEQNNIPVFVVSHKTQYPYLGPKYDLHEAARGWLERYGFASLARDVFFELTKEAKLARIGLLNCEFFLS